MTDRKAEAIAELSSMGVKFGDSSGAVEAKVARRAAFGGSGDRRQYSVKSQCARKACYWSKDDAMKAIRKIGNVYVQPYSCVHCHGWHNGNAPKR